MNWCNLGMGVVGAGKSQADLEHFSNQLLWFGHIAAVDQRKSTHIDVGWE